MERIQIGRYKNPELVGYECWMKTSRWIIWVDRDGNLSIGTDLKDGDLKTGGGINELTVVEA